MGVELFDAYGQTDMKLIVAFRNFANVPKRESLLLLGPLELDQCALRTDRNVNVIF